MKEVLILTASTGGGHNRAAAAIARAFEEKNCNCIIIDGIKAVSPMLDKFISEAYENSAKYTPNAYGKLYKLTDNLFVSPEKEAIVNTFLKGRLKRVIQMHNSHLIVGTHPFPLMAVAKMKEIGEIDIPIISVLTDYTTHASWFKPGIDAYIVGSDDLKYMVEVEELAKPEQVFSFGIPVNPDFFKPGDLSKIKKELNLEEKFTVLLMGGSFGAGNLKESLGEIADIEGIQIIVVAGRNVALKEKLEMVVKQKEYRNVRVLGFTDKISELMSLADVLISKPGGLTLTESLLKQLPLIVPFYIPGGEEENLDFLLNHGLAFKTTRKYPLKLLLKMLMDRPWELELVKERMKRFAKPNAAKDLVNLGFKLMERGKEYKIQMS